MKIVPFLASYSMECIRAFHNVSLSINAFMIRIEGQILINIGSLLKSPIVMDWVTRDFQPHYDWIWLGVNVISIDLWTPALHLLICNFEEISRLFLYLSINRSN